MDEDDTHEKLMRLFRQYFAENQIWERKQTHTSGIKCRNLLAEIRILARKRRAEIMEKRHNKPYMGSETKTKSNQRKAEIKKTKQVDVVVLPESTDNGTS